MVRFTSAPLHNALPKPRQRQASLRKQTQDHYRQLLQSAVVDHHQALVVELDPDDKPLTIRNRIVRAADTLGITNLVIRRRGQRVIAYQGTAEEAQEADESAIDAEQEAT